MSSATALALPQPAPASSRHKVTDVVRTFRAHDVDICKQGDLTALHFYTPHGQVTVFLPLDAAVAKLRARTDSNGVPLPSVVKSNDSVLAQDAAALAPQKGRKPYAHRAAVEAGHLAVWKAVSEGSKQPMAVLTAIHGVRPDTFYLWAKTHDATKWEKLKRFRAGVANSTELAELGFPISQAAAPL